MRAHGTPRVNLSSGLTVAVLRPRLTVLLLLFASGELGLGETRDYVGQGGPAGGSDAVVVRNAHLMHTAQFLPLDAEGQISSDGPSGQIETLFDNLAAALRSQGSDLSETVRSTSWRRLLSGKLSLGTHIGRE